MSKSSPSLCHYGCGMTVLTPGQKYCDRCNDLLLAFNSDDDPPSAATQDPATHSFLSSFPPRYFRKAKSNNAIHAPVSPLSPRRSSPRLSSIFSKLFPHQDANIADTMTTANVPKPNTSYFQIFMNAYTIKNNIELRNTILNFFEHIKGDSFVTSASQAEAFHSFCATSSSTLITLPCLSKFSGNVEQLQVCIERLVTAHLYTTFIGTIKKESRKDLQFSRKINSLHWVTEEHLLIPGRIYNNPKLRFQFHQAQYFLRMLVQRFSPLDKLRSISRCCRQLFALMSELQPGKAANADDFLPMLVFCLLKTNPSHLPSLLQFINKFSNPSRLSVGEGAYFFTTLSCAVSFVENCTGASLGISEEEFERRIRDSDSDMELKFASVQNRLQLLQANCNRLWQRTDQLVSSLKTHGMSPHVVNLVESLLSNRCLKV